MNKDQLTKLASLDNPKTNKFLEDFALLKKKEIIYSKTNEEIINCLELLGVIYHKIPKTLGWVINYLLYKAPQLPADEINSVLGNFLGKTHDEVLEKCLDLVKSIRYYNVDQTIKFSFDFIDHPNQKVSAVAAKLIEELSEYNHQVLPKIGIIPQRKVIDFIKQKVKVKNLKERDVAFIKIAIKHILETSSSSSVMTSPDTLTFSSGDIYGHANIAKIRHEAIVYVFGLFKESISIKNKLVLFFLFEQACRMPMNSANDSDLGKIIQKDRAYVVRELTRLTFVKGKIIQEFSLCMQAEHLMYWFFIHMNLQSEIGEGYIRKLYKDNNYKLAK